MIAVMILLVVLTAASGSIFKPGVWYDGLRKPVWTPPKLVFPVVWTVLYVMIVIAGWLVWRQAGWSLALLLWTVQLIPNALWSFLFFGRRRMDLALLDVIVLWCLVAGFILAAWPISIWASVLFVPYLIWLSMAAALNLTVLRMNPSMAASG